MHKIATSIPIIAALCFLSACGDSSPGTRSEAIAIDPPDGAVATSDVAEPTVTSDTTSAASPSNSTSSTAGATPLGDDLTTLEPFPLDQSVDLGVSAGRLRPGGSALFAVAPGGDTIYRIDPVAGEVTGEFDLPGEPNPQVGTFLGFFDGDVWAMNAELDVVRRIDPDALTIAAEIPIPTGGPAGNYWLQPGDQPVVNGYGDNEVVHLVDPTTDSIVGSYETPKADGSLVAFESIWVTNIERGTVTRLPLGAPDDRSVIDVGGTPGMIASTADAVWVLDRRNATVTAIDPATNETTTTIALVPNATNGFVNGFATDIDGNVVVTVETTDGPPRAGIAVIDPASGQVCQVGLLPDGTLPGGLQPFADDVYVLLVPASDAGTSSIARLDTRC